MKVYLIRHGNAEPSSPTGDDGRQLTPEGVRRLQAASAGWQRVAASIDRVFCSPLIRARQTAEIFRQAVGHDRDLLQTPSLTPSARPLEALELLQAEMLGGARGVACVGHEPHMGSLLGLLLTGSERSAIPFRKGMLAVIELDSSATMVGRLVCSMTQDTAAEI